MFTFYESLLDSLDSTFSPLLHPYNQTNMAARPSKISPRLVIHKDEAIPIQSSTSLMVTGKIPPSVNDPDLNSDDEGGSNDQNKRINTMITEDPTPQASSSPLPAREVKIAPDRLANIERRLAALEELLMNTHMAVESLKTSMLELNTNLKLIVPAAPRVITHNPGDNFREFDNELY